MRENPLLHQQLLSMQARASTTRSPRRAQGRCSPPCLRQAPAWVALHSAYLNTTLAASAGCSERPCLPGRAIKSCSRVSGSRGWPAPGAATGAGCKGQWGNLLCKTPRRGRSVVIREFRSSSLLVGYTTFPKHSLSSCIPEARIPCWRSSPRAWPGIALWLHVGPLPNTSLIEQTHLARMLELRPGEKSCNYPSFCYFLPIAIYSLSLTSTTYKHHHTFSFVFHFLSI